MVRDLDISVSEADLSIGEGSAVVFSADGGHGDFKSKISKLKLTFFLKK